MKNYLLKSLIVLTVLMFVYINAKSVMTIEFITSGNCYYCKLRIEGAVNPLPGVYSSEWSATNQSTTVSYNEAVIDAFTIMHAVADVGHDTEWYEAPQAAYDSLIGTCCEYPRVLQYGHINIGFLSLMGIYVYPLSINENLNDNNCIIYPIPSKDFLNISVPDENNALDLIIYNSIGQKVIETNFNNKTQIDVKPLEDGDYIAIIRKENAILLRKKITIIN